jgi:hypothetical protein
MTSQLLKTICLDLMCVIIYKIWREYKKISHWGGPMKIFLKFFLSSKSRYYLIILNFKINISMMFFAEFSYELTCHTIDSEDPAVKNYQQA